MKKVNASIAAFTVLVLLSACRKDRSCTCTYTESGVTIKETIVYHKVSNRTAKSDCVNQPVTFIDSGGTAVTISLSCVLN